MITSVVGILLLIFGISFSIMWLVNKSNNIVQTKPIEETKHTSTEVVEESQTSQPNQDPSLKEQEKKINDLMKSMSLEEKVGQLFLARVPIEAQQESLQEYHLGGYLLFGRDMENETPNSLKEKIYSYQEVSKIPLFITSDEEGGTVSRLSGGNGLVTKPFKSPMEIYQEAGLTGIRSDIQQKSAVLRSYGIQVGLFPDADVATDPEAFIYDRTIGVDAEKTSEYVKASVEALKKQQIASTLKHFPGYGDNRDSHVEIVYDTRSLETLRGNDFLPFKAGIAAGTDSIMVSHNIVTSIDDTMPASISQPVHDLLRNELGFQGVIMTDDMDMAGLADFITQEEAGLAALKSGNDLILSSSFQVQIPYVIQAIEQGSYSEEALNQSVYRVLKMKSDLGLLNH
ncbi:beta-hexosaminidase [Enterococcus plantarum]|uniref:beta-N-acetylhexosaminidase n=2 Tax=Enterococcus plantarum TaxID=1077675 RepID=A0A2W3Z795_9ENTE|nr:beta-hexosaminidase [Enterococcus plantarum]